MPFWSTPEQVTAAAETTVPPLDSDFCKECRSLHGEFVSEQMGEQSFADLSRVIQDRLRKIARKGGSKLYWNDERMKDPWFRDGLLRQLHKDGVPALHTNKAVGLVIYFDVEAPGIRATLTAL